MQHWPAKYRWLASYAVGIVLLLIPEVLIGQLFLKVPTTKLFQPVAVLAVILLAAGPFLYNGRKQARENGDARFMTVTVWLLLLVLLVIGAYFGVRLGVISAKAARSYILTSVILMPIYGVMTYLIMKSWTARRFGQK